MIQDAWNELTEAEYNVAWDAFYDLFNFKPSVHPQDWPGIKEPQPSVTYNMSTAYGAASHFETLASDLSIKTLGAFKKCVPAGQPLYALDWQHTCYWFCPHKPFPSNDLVSWPVPILPDGDYYIFLSTNFNFGLFGHPWEKTICVFGQSLLSALAEDNPTIFSNPVRRNGMPL